VLHTFLRCEYRKPYVVPDQFRAHPHGGVHPELWAWQAAHCASAGCLDASPIPETTMGVVGQWVRNIALGQLNEE